MPIRKLSDKKINLFRIYAVNPKQAEIMKYLDKRRDEIPVEMEAEKEKEKKIKEDIDKLMKKKCFRKSRRIG